MSLTHVKVVNASQTYNINRFKNIKTDSCAENFIDLFIPLLLLLDLFYLLIVGVQVTVAPDDTQTHTHTHTHTLTLTHGKTPLDEGSTRGRDLYLTKLNIHNKLTFMPTVGFEPVIPARERPQTYALDCASIGISLFPCLIKQTPLSRILLTSSLK